MKRKSQESPQLTPKPKRTWNDLLISDLLIPLWMVYYNAAKKRKKESSLAPR